MMPSRRRVSVTAVSSCAADSGGKRRSESVEISERGVFLWLPTRPWNAKKMAPLPFSLTVFLPVPAGVLLDVTDRRRLLGVRTPLARPPVTLQQLKFFPQWVRLCAFLSPTSVHLDCAFVNRPAVTTLRASELFWLHACLLPFVWPPVALPPPLG